MRLAKQRGEAKRKEQEDKDNAAKTARTDIRGFMADKPTLQQGRVRELLTGKPKYQHEGERLTGRDLVEKLVGRGYEARTIEDTDHAKLDTAYKKLQNTTRMTAQEQRSYESTTKNPPKKTYYRMYNKDGGYLEVSKVEHDYAQHLARGKNRPTGPAPADTGIFRDLTAAAREGKRFVEALHTRIAPVLARIHAAAQNPVEFMRQAVAEIGEHIRPYVDRFLADVREVNAEFAANPKRGSVPAVGKALLGLPKKIAEKFSQWDHYGLPPQLWEKYVDSQTGATAMESDLSRHVSAMEKAIPKNQQIPKDVIYKAIQGDPQSMQQVGATPLRQVADAARAGLDESSERIAVAFDNAASMSTGQNAARLKLMAQNIRDNKGTWLKRAYRMFDYNDVEKWIDKAIKMPEWQTAAKEFGGEGNLRTYLKGLGQDGIHGLATGESPGARMQMSNLKQRKDLSPALRAVLGEITDPIEAYSRSVKTNAGLATRAEFQNEVAKYLQGQVFDATEANKVPRYYSQLPDTGSYGPLRGKYIPDDMYKALTSLDAPGGFNNPIAQAVMDVYDTYLGGIKSAKTSLNFPLGQVRQIPGNITMMLANGDWSGLPLVNLMTQGKEPFKAVYNNFAEGTSLGKTTPYSKAVSIAKKYGILNSNIEAESIAVHGRRLANSRNPKVAAAAEAVNRNAIRPAGRAYSVPDNLTKFHAMLSKFEQYKNSNRAKKLGWTEDDVLEFAAKEVQRTYPNSYRMGRAARTVINSPVGGTFSAFQLEQLRSHARIIRSIAEDAKYGDKAIASRKIIGNLAVAAILPGLAVLAKNFYGVSEDQDQVNKAAAPGFLKNSFTIPFGGKRRVADIEIVNGYPIVVVANKVMMGMPVGTALKEFVRDIVGGGIPAQKLMEFIANEKESGAPVYQERATTGEKVGAFAKQMIVDPLTPGFVNEAQRIGAAVTGGTYKGNKIKPADEITRLATGLTPYDVEAPKALAKLVREYSTGWSSLYKDKMRDKGADKNAVLREINARRKEKYDEIRSLFKAMKSSGSSTKDINAALKDYGLSAKSIEQFEKNYVAYAPGRLR
jgi:hypothetical protein